MELHCFEIWGKVTKVTIEKLQNASSLGRPAENKWHNAYYNTLILERFYINTGGIFQLSNLDFMPYFEILLFVLWHTHNK